MKGYKYPKIIVDGNEYFIHIKEKGKTRWTCKNYRRSKCKSIIYTTGKVVKVYNEHNHEPMYTNVNNLDFASQCVIIQRHSKPAKYII